MACKVLEDVVLNACGETEMAREQEKRTGTGHALVAPDWPGRGDGGGLNGGRGGLGGERGNSRRNSNEGEQQHLMQ